MNWIGVRPGYDGRSAVLMLFSDGEHAKKRRRFVLQRKYGVRWAIASCCRYVGYGHHLCRSVMTCAVYWCLHNLHTN